MILINNDSGQLCNKLLLLANVYATAINTNQKVYHMYWKCNTKHFQKTKNRDLRWFPIKLGRLFPYYERYIYNRINKQDSYWECRKKQERKKEIIKSGSKSKLYVVDGWYYRDYEALFRYRDRIIELFHPTTEIEERIDRFWEEACIPDVITIGVHMRRGDYRVWENGRFYFTDETYKKWMIDLAEDTPNKLQFILCSNEEINLPNFESDRYSVCKAPGTQMEDLYTLARCDYIMGPPSTYSWWAAYFGDRHYLTLYCADRRIELGNFCKVEGEEFSVAHAEKMGLIQ